MGTIKLHGVVDVRVLANRSTRETSRQRDLRWIKFELRSRQREISPNTVAPHGEPVGLARLSFACVCMVYVCVCMVCVCVNVTSKLLGL